MARKPSSLKDVKVATLKPDINIICTRCGEEKNAMKDFYASYSSKIATAPFCKECVMKGSLTKERDSVDIDGFQNMLQQLDRPYLHQLFLNNLKKFGSEPEKVIGWYMKDISMPQYKILNWSHSDFGHVNEEKVKEKTIEETPKKNNKKVAKMSIKQRDELVDKWGEYSEKELSRFEKKYQQMSKSYQILTNLHEEGLIDFCRLQCLYEMAIEQKNTQEAKTFKSLADEAKKNAKLNPLQLKKDDLQVGGVDSFSQMSDLVARRNGLINIPMEYFKKPKDILDYQILENINYMRASFNMTELTYEDINKTYLDRIEKFNERFDADVMNNDFGTWGD